LTFLSSLASSLQLSFGRDEMLTHPAKINFHKTYANFYKWSE
jgi:hypothetical protein